MDAESVLASDTTMNIQFKNCLTNHKGAVFSIWLADALHRESL